MMDRTQIRMELIKLIVPQHASVASLQDTDNMINKAKALEAYVCEVVEEKPKKRQPKRNTRSVQSQDNSQEPAKAD